MRDRLINSYFGILNKFKHDEETVTYKAMKQPHPIKGFNKTLFPRQKTWVTLNNDSDEIPKSYVNQYKELSSHLTSWKTAIAEQIRDIVVKPINGNLTNEEIFDTVVVERVEIRPNNITIVRLRFKIGILHKYGFDLYFDPEEPRVFNGRISQYYD